MGYIYKITNKINNKIYIGQTIKTRPTDRFSQHKYLANHPDQEKGISYLHRAMKTEGIDNFIFEIIENIDNSLLDEREKYWIQYYNSKIPFGYNICDGGKGTIGYSRKQSIEEKQKRQQSNKQFYINNPEARHERSLIAKNLWQNEEYRKKVTESNRQFYATHPDKFSGKNNPFYGKHHSQETIEKIKQSSLSKYKKIAQLDKDTLKEIRVFDGIKEAEKALNISHGWISKAARTNKIAYGYRWKII